MTTTDNPNVANNNGWTPIHSAAKEGHIEILKILMVSTDNPNVANNNGLTPIRVAANGWHFGIVKILRTTTDNLSFVDNRSIILEFHNMIVYYFTFYMVILTFEVFGLSVLLFGPI